MAQVRVRFTTDASEYQVTDVPFAVPVKLGRKGLSQVVNHLLGSSDAVAFDFTIGDILLRDSLRKFIVKQGLNTENVVELRYFPSSALSKEKGPKQELPSWVGALSYCAATQKVHAGLYDGKYDVLDAVSLKSGLSAVAHQAPVRVIAALGAHDTDLEGGEGAFVTGSKDHSLRVVSALGDVVKESRAHQNSVESLALLSGKQLMFSGDFSGALSCWDMSPSSSPLADKAKKSRKRGSPDEWSPVFSLKAHSQSTSGIVNDPNNAGRNLITSSYDHSLKLWDVDRQDCVHTVAGARVITSLSAAQPGSSRHVATAHPDGVVRLWDLRIAAGAEGISGAVSLLGSSGPWTACVAAHPTDGTKLASCDYDGAVHLWDVRSSRALDKRALHDGKALCVAWGASEEGVVLYSGGSDCCVKATCLT